MQCLPWQGLGCIPACRGAQQEAAFKCQIQTTACQGLFIHPSAWEMDPEAMSDCRAGAATALSCCREWHSAHRAQSTWDICALQKAVTAWDRGLTAARAAQGRAAQQAGHNISYPPCLAEDGHLNHILVPRGRRITHGKGERGGFAPSTVPGAVDD